jgi:copper chaperone CopZ
VSALRRQLPLLGLLAVGGVLAFIALRAPEPTYAVPVRAADIPLAIQGEIPDGFVVRTFAVEGICCQSCAGKLQGVLAPLEGVARVAVDPLRKEVQALVRAEVDHEELVRALTFDKYSARLR